MHKIFYDLSPTYVKENFVPFKLFINIVQSPVIITFLVPNCQNLDKSTFTYAGIVEWE